MNVTASIVVQVDTQSGVGGMGADTSMSVEHIEKGAQHTALWGAGAGYLGGMMTVFFGIGMIVADLGKGGMMG